MYYVYILKSRLNGSFYKGMTDDVKKRLLEHNSGKEKSTSRYKPWDLVWYTSKNTRSEAVVLEKKLKNITSRLKTEQFIEKYKVTAKFTTHFFISIFGAQIKTCQRSKK